MHRVSTGQDKASAEQLSEFGDFFAAAFFNQFLVSKLNHDMTRIAYQDDYITVDYAAAIQVNKGFGQ
jgi:hypothetical protein